jgi:hypothetical protein
LNLALGHVKNDSSQSWLCGGGSIPSGPDWSVICWSCASASEARTVTFVPMTFRTALRPPGLTMNGFGLVAQPSCCDLTGSCLSQPRQSLVAQHWGFRVVSTRRGAKPRQRRSAAISGNLACAYGGVRGNGENPLGQRDCEGFEGLPYGLRDLVHSKKTLRRCVKLRRLKGIERASDAEPGLRASQLRHTLDEQGENANPHMRLNAMRKPMKHWGHLDLRPLQRTKTARNDQKAFIAAGGILQTDRIVIGFEHPFPIVDIMF